MSGINHINSKWRSETSPETIIFFGNMTLLQVRHLSSIAGAFCRRTRACGVDAAVVGSACVAETWRSALHTNTARRSAHGPMLAPPLLPSVTPNLMRGGGRVYSTDASTGAVWKLPTGYVSRILVSFVRLVRCGCASYCTKGTERKLREHDRTS
jgi:hypothetical protein